MKNLFIKLSILCLPTFIFSHGVSESDKAEMVQGGLSDFFILGAKHMITGYDHILFLIGVIFFLSRFADIAKFITAFTIGHSITLIFATFYEINANYYLIDAVIAFSVIYKGFENLNGFNKWLSINVPNKVFMVFIFGLIHGFGLSTRLQQINLGHHQLVYKILSFNAGVEIGQITALIIAFPILLLLRKKLSNISTITNLMLIIAGLFLLVFQLNGYYSAEANAEKLDIQKLHEIHLENNTEDDIHHHEEEHQHNHNDNEDHHHNH